MTYYAFPLGPLETNCYLLSDPAGKSLLIDPVIASPEIEETIRAKKLTLEAIAITHSHMDHVHAAAEYAALYKVPVLMHDAAEKLRAFYAESCQWLGFPVNELIKNYLPLNKMKTLSVGSETMTVLTTPGHSPCGISLVGGELVVTGDVLFQGSVGRYDLPFASLPQLYTSLKKLAALPDQLIILPGHGEVSTIGAEKAENPYLRTVPGGKEDI